MKYLLHTALVVVLTTAVTLQAGDDYWSNLATINTQRYEIKIPKAWKNLKEGKTAGPEQLFEASGYGVPGDYLRKPVITTVFLTGLNVGTLQAAREATLQGFAGNPGRIPVGGAYFHEKKFKTADGTPSIVFYTRYHNAANGLYQSRYDLITYSGKQGKAYLYTVIVQHSDSEFGIDNKHRLTQFSDRLFGHFRWK